jgi:hypothetical protein
MRLGPRGARRLAGAILAVVLVAAPVAIVLIGGGGSSSGSSGRSATRGSSARYGGLPSWLPRPKIPVNRIEVASSAHQVLAIQGDAVSVDLRGGGVLANAVGPSVPEEGHYPLPVDSPATFVVTFTHASGVVPINANAFTFIDELAHLHHPRTVSSMEGGSAPTRILPGQTVSLKVYGMLPTGDGALTWAPNGERRPIVSWNYELEVD